MSDLEEPELEELPYPGLRGPSRWNPGDDLVYRTGGLETGPGWTDVLIVGKYLWESYLKQHVRTRREVYMETGRGYKGLMY